MRLWRRGSIPGARAAAIAVLLLLSVLSSAAGDWSTEPLPRRIVAGESLAAVIDELRASGAPLAYSSALLPDELRVIQTPRSRQVLSAVYEILAAHELTLHEMDGVYIVGHREATVSTPPFGAVLIRFRDAETDAVVSGVRISGLPDSALQSRDRTERSINVEMPPGSYPIVISAPGYVNFETKISATVNQPQTLTLSLSPRSIPLTEVVVAASRYEMMRDAVDTSFGIDRQSIMQTPDTGDDPIRAVQRLPATASSGVSARPHLRGSADRDSGIVLDGHRLLNPFHLRDYQSLFSTIDVRAIDGIKVYTGGFPVQYGDLTGGLVLVDSLTPEKGFRNEFGLSVFNTSILSAGQIPAGDTEYVLSVRRGNLDLVLDEEIGEPSYYDAYGKVIFNLSPDSTVSANLMQIKDTVTIIPSADPDEREEASNDTRNSQFWVSWEQQWTDALSSQTVVSASDFISGRHALINYPEKIRGQLSDERTIRIMRLNQDWNYAWNESHQLSWG
ncbi:MAG: TonB-dependent receptor plug domain-containing protein, partial [Halioglobus sp.]|nr:TonB-dependent receptor plug domain-containing protein [Halioglobus sp.]